MSTNLQNIVEQLSTLTILEAAELVKMLEEKWGVSAAAPAAAVMVAGNAAPVAAEKTEFDIILEAIGDNKIGVIKELRAIMPSLSLTDAKALAESAPKTLKEAASKDEADSMKAKLEAVGAKVKIS